MTTATGGRAAPWVKLLPALLALTLVASACGDDSADTADATPASSVEAIDSGTTPDPDTAAAQDAPDDTAGAATETGVEDETAAGTVSASDSEDTASEAGEREPAPAGDDEGSTGERAPAADKAATAAEEHPIQRIVSISPTATEMLFAIGAGDRVVAVDQFSYYPDEAPVTNIDGWNPNIEAIASYEPDLVTMQSSGEVSASLETLGIEVFAHDAPFVFDDVYAQIEQLGIVTGQTDEAGQLVADMRAEITELIAAAPDAAGLTYYHELDDTLYSVTGSTFIGQVYSLFGLVNVADPVDEDGGAWGYPQLSDEYLVDADPDVIFLADTRCCGQDAQTVAERPGWDQMTAVQTGRIVELNDDIASRWGPRLVEFIEAISDVLVSTGAAG